MPDDAACSQAPAGRPGGGAAREEADRSAALAPPGVAPLGGAVVLLLAVGPQPVVGPRPAVSRPHAAALPAAAARQGAVVPPPGVGPQPAAAPQPLRALVAAVPVPPAGFAPPGAAALPAVGAAGVSGAPQTRTARWDTPAERRSHPRDYSIAQREPISQLPHSTPPGAQRQNPRSARTTPRAFAGPSSPSPRLPAPF